MQKTYAQVYNISMDRFIQENLKNKSPIKSQLLSYGFVEQGKKLIYKTFIMQKDMELTICIENGKISSQIYDIQNEEPYTLFLIEEMTGRYVEQVRWEYEHILKDIAEKCFETDYFKSHQAKQIIKYIKQKYGDELEYLWDKFPNNAIWRRQDNKKWYALLISLPKNKLGADSSEIVEIIDLRINPEEIEGLVDNQKYFKAYHMNKKHWITICLDDSVDINEIYARIDESYLLAK